jgi:hypothetical protein
VLVFVTLQHIVEGGIANNLTFIITHSLMQQGRLIRKEVGERLIFFCVYGTFLFKGCCIGATF